MDRFLKPYYIFNILLLSSYPITRQIWNSIKLQIPDTFGYTRENGILFTSLVVLWIYYRKAATVEQFFNSIFWIGKVVFTVLFYLMTPRFACYFLIGCAIVVFAFFRQPKYSGPSNMSKIVSEKLFDELVCTEYQGKRPQDGEKSYEHMNMWFVEFYLDWAETCVFTKSIWAGYSLKYTTERLKFGEVNLALVPELAKRYNINTSVMSRQLPTLIMFEDGKEVDRFPPYSEEAKAYMKVVKYDRRQLAKFFDLEKRFLATKFLNLEKKGPFPQNKPNDQKEKKKN